MDSKSPIPSLALEDLTHSFKQGPRELKVLDGAKAKIYPGETVALLGPSGAGKSTLLHIAGLLEQPASGKVLIGGVDCGALDDKGRTRMRRQEIGFVYQFHHLMPEFSAAENIVLPQMIMGRGRKAAEIRADELLATFGLTERADHRPAQLSGGEQQRVAIARAMANEPALLLADEPTGNLDPSTGERVFDELLALVRNSAVGALIATHNLELASRMDRVLRLTEGELVEETVIVGDVTAD